MTSREQDIADGDKGGHALSPIQREARRNASTGRAGIVHRIGSEITRDSIERGLARHEKK